LLLLILPLTIVVGLPCCVLCNFHWAVVGIVTSLTTMEESLPNRGARSTSLHLRARECILTILGGCWDDDPSDMGARTDSGSG
jgi:hypothetical protein